MKQIFNEKKPKNDFEEWCSKALQGLQAQVDIPTFLGFLMDIESPYEVTFNSPSFRIIINLIRSMTMSNLMSARERLRRSLLLTI